MNKFYMKEPFWINEIGKGKIEGISKKTIDANEKIIDYQSGRPCPSCHMIKDAGVKGECEYCLSVFAKEGDYDV